MRMLPWEEERLQLFVAAELARRHRAAGVLLSQPEVVALVCDAMLEAANFFFPPDRVPTSKRTIRTMLTKPGWSSQEVRTMRGVLSALSGKKASRS